MAQILPVARSVREVAGRARVGEPGRAGAAGVSVLGVLSGRLEKPGLCLLELVHVGAVVREKGACGLHVAHARELQLEVDPVALALGFEIGDLAAQLLGRLGVPRRLGHLGLQGGDLLVALGDLLLVVGGVVYLRLALLRFLLLLALLLRRVLRTLRGFLAAIGLTVHVSACLSSRKAGRDEQCPHLYRYGHCLGVSQGDGFISCPSYQRVREKGIGKRVRFSG